MSKDNDPKQAVKPEEPAQTEFHFEFLEKLNIKRPSEMEEVMPDQTLNGLLHKQQVMMISGSSKARKSWLLLQLCVCAASGVQFLNFDVKRGKVLYVNFELLEPEARRRLGQVAKALKLKNVPEDNISVACLRGKERFSMRNLSSFKEKIKKEGYAFIVIDPFYKLNIGKDELTIEGVSKILHEMEVLAMFSETSVIFAHHFSKGPQTRKKAMDRASGSGGFARSPDTLFTMTGDDSKGSEEMEFAIDIDVRSFPPIKRFGIKFAFPIFVVDDSIDLSTKTVRSKKGPKITDEQLLIPLRVNLEGLPFMKWFNTMNNGSKATISKAQFSRRVKDLCEYGKAIISDNGNYKDAEKASLDSFVGGVMRPTKADTKHSTSRH